MKEQLLSTINDVRRNKGLPELDAVDVSTRLREDLQLDSLDLAELTVRIESWSGVDVFADGLVHSVGEILVKLDHER